MKEVIALFGVSYGTWSNICDMYLNLSDSSKKSYLQWFPFSKIDDADKKFLRSEKFYEKYIKTFSFVLFEKAMLRSENYLQKGDGSFRDASLVSPVLFLLLQAIGKEIFDKYISVRNENISVYYAGNYQFMRPKYKKDYDDFYKEINASLENFQYFIKTDITSFFSNINIDKLISRIEKICNSAEISFSANQLNLFKELLIYCGDGRFPIIENSVASSFLATVVYLDEVDDKLHSFILKHIPEYNDFKMIRYVDDLYILISSNCSMKELHRTYNEIRNEYSSILKSSGLTLNIKKCCIKETFEINEELKKSLYDEYFHDERRSIGTLFSGKFKEFIKNLSMELNTDSIDTETYNDIIKKNFSTSNIEFTASEIFNYFIYEDNTELCSVDTVNEIVRLIRENISFISLDPKRLTIMILKTKSDVAIKLLLCQLFEVNRNGKWNSYYTTIAIAYLVQRGFKHSDLLDIIKKQNLELYDYYKINCKGSFVKVFKEEKVNRLADYIKDDNKAKYLYFMYWCEKSKHNYMAAFAFYKNFFDRVTADMDFIVNQSKGLKRPNYKGFYKKGAFKDFYKTIDGNQDIIDMAHDLRNENPISHSSSALLDNNNTSQELNKSINDLSYLIFEYISLSSYLTK